MNVGVRTCALMLDRNIDLSLVDIAIEYPLTVDIGTEYPLTIDIGIEYPLTVVETVSKYLYANI